jgi:hypothetical protein
VLDKYLKSRRGRELSLDEIVLNVIKVRRFTIERRQEIDETWRAGEALAKV